MSHEIMTIKKMNMKQNPKRLIPKLMKTPWKEWQTGPTANIINQSTHRNLYWRIWWINMKQNPEKTHIEINENIMEKNGHTGPTASIIN